MRSRFTTCLVGLTLTFGSALGADQLRRPVFLGPDGRPLPIQEDADILAFLRTARETGSKTLREGITKAKRLDLTKGDIEARAIFHFVDEVEQKIKRLPNDEVVGWVRDHYTSQVAAYEVGRLLEIHNIPPTVLRRSGELQGSAQLWIEKAMTVKDRQELGELLPADSIWNQLNADMNVFDNLINNIDRNTGNMLVDSYGHLWLIDHTRSFGQDKGLPRPEMITRCSRRLYHTLQQLDEREVRRRLRPPGKPKSRFLLLDVEIKALFSRRQKLLEKLDKRIRDRGEEAILFDYGDPEPGISVSEDPE